MLKVILFLYHFFKQSKILCIIIPAVTPTFNESTKVSGNLRYSPAGTCIIRSDKLIKPEETPTDSEPKMMTTLSEGISIFDFVEIIFFYWLKPVEITR